MDKLLAVMVEELRRQLEPAIREVVRSEMQFKLAEEYQEKLIAPSEACKVFSPPISKVTLKSWTDAGHLTDYRISGRVFYRVSEIINAAKHLKKYKRPV